MTKDATPAKRKFNFRKKKEPDYEQNVGIAGVVYILTNRGLAYNYLKIGCTRYSGSKRADDLNKKAPTGTPSQYKCAFEQKTVDCGLAEKRVHERLKEQRAPTQKKMQEFFHIDLTLARKAIIEECQEVDKEYEEREKKADKEKKFPLIKSRGTRSMLGRYDALKNLGN